MYRFASAPAGLRLLVMHVLVRRFVASPLEAQPSLTDRAQGRIHLGRPDAARVNMHPGLPGTARHQCKDTLQLVVPYDVTH